MPERSDDLPILSPNSVQLSSLCCEKWALQSYSGNRVGRFVESSLTQAAFVFDHIEHGELRRKLEVVKLQ